MAPFALIMVFFFVGLMSGHIDRLLTSVALGFVISIVVGMALIATDNGRRQEEVSRETPKYEAARQRWNKAYYCTRHDVVFIADQQPISPDQFQGQLYSVLREDRCSPVCHPDRSEERAKRRDLPLWAYEEDPSITLAGSLHSG